MNPRCYEQKSKHSSGKSKSFSWCKLSKRINKGATATEGPVPSGLEQVYSRRDSSSSSEDDFDSRVTSRQKELLRSSPNLSGGHEKIRPLQPEHKKEWVKSARQRELIQSGSASTLSRVSNKECQSALRKAWPSTAQRRDNLTTPKGDLAGSAAGDRKSPLSDSRRNSARSARKIENGARLLVEAVRLGRTRHLKLLLDGGTDPNAPDHEGVTPLIAAVADVKDVALRRRLIQLLLDAGADPNVGDEEGTTPLMYAASNNYHEAAVTLLQHSKTDPGLQNNKGFSTLMLAASQGYSTIVLLILASFKKIHHVTYLGQKNSQGLTAYDLAQQNGHFDVWSLLQTDVAVAPRPQGLAGCIPAVHDLSRTPTPTDSFEFSDQEFYDEEKDLKIQQTFRPPTPVSDIENLDSLSFECNRDSNVLGFINEIEVTSSSGSGNEADIESLMDDDHLSVNESEKEDHLTTSSCNMSSPAVKSASSSVGLYPSEGSSLISSNEPSEQVSFLSSAGNFAVKRSAIEKLKSFGYSVQGFSSRKDGIVGTNLNPLIKISGSPTKEMPIMITDSMPQIGLSASSKSLNKSIKSLVQEDFEMRPGNRPPTPARPSLPTLLSVKQDSSTEGSLSNSSHDVMGRSRRVTIATFPRSTSEQKVLSVPPSQKNSQDEYDNTADILDASTKSEGWDVLLGSRGRSLMSHSEGHVVPLPPIGQKFSLKSREDRKFGSSDEENVLNVAKRTLERLETVLSHQCKSNRRNKPSSRSNPANQQLDMSS